MTSPFVRRRRLGSEIRALREERGLTADELSQRVYRSRMSISKLENARCRPNIGVVMKILDALDVPPDKYRDIVAIARDAAEPGWWDTYGNAMGPRQRMYADIESGADTIRGYYQVAIPGILQTPDFIWALIDLDLPNGPLPYKPERMFNARLERQRNAFGANGPTLDLIMDEFLIRRLAVPSDIMSAQLLHVVDVASAEARLTLRVLPINARIEGGFSAKSTFTIYTFPDINDPAMAVADTVNTDIVHTKAEQVAQYIDLYERLWTACLSPVKSLSLLEEAANQLANLAGS